MPNMKIDLGWATLEITPDHKEIHVLVKLPAEATCAKMMYGQAVSSVQGNCLAITKHEPTEAEVMAEYDEAMAPKTYRTMTRGGSYGSDVVALDDEEAERKAEDMGYTVLDITEHEGHLVLVIAD